MLAAPGGNNTDLIAAHEDSEVAVYSLVKAVLLPTQALLDGVLGDH